MSTDPSAFTCDAFLTDSAAVAEGKLYLQGAGWNMLQTLAFPFKQPRIGIGAIVGVPWTQTNRGHKLEISLSDDDGPVPLVKGVARSPEGVDQEVTGMSLTQPFNIGRPSHLEPGDRQNVPLALNLDGLVFEKPGSYSFSLTIDDEELNRLAFRVTSPVGITLSR